MAVFKYQSVLIFLLVVCISVDDFAAARFADNWFQPPGIALPSPVSNEDTRVARNWWQPQAPAQPMPGLPGGFDDHNAFVDDDDLGNDDHHDDDLGDDVDHDDKFGDEDGHNDDFGDDDDHNDDFGDDDDLDDDDGDDLGDNDDHGNEFGDEDGHDDFDPSAPQPLPRRPVGPMPPKPPPEVRVKGAMLHLHGIDQTFLRSAGSDFKMQCMKGKENVECFVADPKPLIVNLAGSSGSTGRVVHKPPPPKPPVRVGPPLKSVERVCLLEHKVTKMKCSTGRISVKSAMYGRKSGVKCNDEDRHVSSRVNCEADGVIEKVQERCDDEKSCELKATNHVYGDPCGGVVKYLDVHYTCK